MTKIISDTQRAILMAAARREDGAIRLPARVKGGAAAKTIQSLIKAGLITDKLNWRSDKRARARRSFPRSHRGVLAAGLPYMRSLFRQRQAFICTARTRGLVSGATYKSTENRNA